jgi:predicted dehydrogenase
MNKSISRRKFIGTTAGTAAAFTIVPSYAISGNGHVAPSDKLNIAGIGIGGKGKVNLKNMVKQNIVALCDVDWSYSHRVFQTYPDAVRYKDFRVMLEKQKDIDAVVIATPDHTHAVSAIAAMELGKHSYVQKPLTHSVYESRYLTQVAQRTGVVTQMGNEGHSSDTVYEVAEVIHSGAIGEIEETHVWTNRPIWPQGIAKPADQMKVPKTLDWDLFIGPAQWRSYHRAYTPWDWRAWWDFGTGALGDMGCHVLDVPFYALKLGYPTAVQASSSLLNTESAPIASRVEYTFPSRENLPYCAMPEVKITWHDGGMLPARPADLPDDAPMNPGGGIMFIGSKGKLICDTYGGNWKVYINGEVTTPEIKVDLGRVNDDPLGGGRHEMEFVRACKDGSKPSSNFDYAGPLSEMVLMGNLAIRLQGLSKTLRWDGQEMNITNIGADEKVKIADLKTKKNKSAMDYKKEWVELPALEMSKEWVKHTYREGWKL